MKMNYLPFVLVELLDEHFEVGTPTAVAKSGGHGPKRVGGAHTHRTSALD
jgi:hypothetical protein